jgi:hypothetical protein
MTAVRGGTTLIERRYRKLIHYRSFQVLAFGEKPV